MNILSRFLVGLLIGSSCFVAGLAVQSLYDARQLTAAHQNEAQAAGLVNDPELAEGEWSIEAQTPPCSSAHNIQVIYPKESGAPIKIECDRMPVAER